MQDILKKKQNQLKSIGKGNRPNAADPLTDEDIDTFYSRKVLGIPSPRALSAVLSNAASTSQNLSAVSLEENTKAESFVSGATSGSLFQNCQTVNFQVYQSGRTEKSSKICWEKKLKITVFDDSSQSQ